jgi:hypothetical protein
MSDFDSECPTTRCRDAKPALPSAVVIGVRGRPIESADESLLGQLVE